MEWDDDIDLSNRKITAQMLIKRARARGWKVGGFSTNPAILVLQLPGSSGSVKIFSASPPQLSYVASKIAKDKFITNRLLAAAGLPVPDEILIRTTSSATDPNLQDFLQRYQKVVVKPLDASHGKGVRTDITTSKPLQRAIAEARLNSHTGEVLVQQQIEGIDIRAVCIDYEFVDAIVRTPAFVIGDGKHTVEQLIQVSNKLRGEDYSTALNKIPIEEAKNFLGEVGMRSIPSPERVVRVIGVANTGMGGTRTNIKRDVPAELRQLMSQVAKTLDLPVCGVDLMVKRLPSMNSTLGQLQAVIIEVNECPSLAMYEDLDSSPQIELLDHYLDYAISIANS